MTDSDKSDIYFIPQSLRCPKCNADLGSPMQLINVVTAIVPCTRCNIVWHTSDFAKQFAVIKGVAT